MAGVSDYLENKILDHLLGNTPYTAPTTVYLALFTVAPNFETGAGGTEVSTTSTGYARLAVSNNTTNFPNASAGSKSNGTTLTFATPLTSWGTVVAYGVYDASTVGNLLFGNNLTNSKTINLGDTVSFAVGALSLTLD